MCGAYQRSERTAKIFNGEAILGFHGCNGMVSDNFPEEVSLDITGCFSSYDAVVKKCHPVALPYSSHHPVGLERWLVCSDAMTGSNKTLPQVSKLGFVVVKIVVAAFQAVLQAEWSTIAITQRRKLGRLMVVADGQLVLKLCCGQVEAFHLQGQHGESFRYVALDYTMKHMSCCCR